MFGVAVYVSNHNSSVNSTLPGSDRHAREHSGSVFYSIKLISNTAISEEMYCSGMKQAG